VRVTRRAPDVARPDALFGDVKGVDRALRRAVREAVLRHKRLGQSVFVLREGRVVEVPASRIRLGSTK